MSQWVLFQEGEYLAESAFILGDSGQSIELNHPIIEVKSGPGGIRTVFGRAMGRPMAIVDLLEESDQLDVLISLGPGLAYRMSNPDIQAGKVFAADVMSAIQFTPTGPWTPMTDADFLHTLQAD